MVVVEVVQEVALVVPGNEGLEGSTEHLALLIDVLLVGEVFSSVFADAMEDFHFKDVNFGLFDGQVCHFEVKTVEVDVVDASVDSVGQSLFTNLVDALLIGDCSILMEFTEEIVEVSSCKGVVNELVPVRFRVQ